MDDTHSGTRDQSATRAAKQLERRSSEAIARADYEAAKQVVEDNLAHQRAQRLARDMAAPVVTAKSKPRSPVRTG